ncbi:hypothetical protein O181_011145 [Austropuccinia psidii MF-1]|uniref:Uncharacterized protein n=1 Tax=Austropuccinia psidii MF-1 TaxID=1389203 RepID=A0A9Q3GLL8_9BASI|nr:hypothetical protein [Austropuccinia psidii MF-1]
MRWFLPQVKAEIEQWAANLNSLERVSDFQQSQAWKTCFPKSKKRKKSLKLAFSLFIDWCNPFGNKLSGQQASVGVIALNCLNLPPTLRFKFQYTYIAGVIPGPDQPDTTISKLIDPLVTQLIQMNAGIRVVTPKSPQGCNVIVLLACLIGDVVATHKVAGFASHSATRFCSWCDCQKSSISFLCQGHPRQKRSTISMSIDWRDSRTLAQRKSIVKKTGIRWSALNRLPYWDPVANVVLGIMHNWFEGVLQHHFRRRWKFGMSPIEQENDENLPDSEEEAESMDYEVHETWLFKKEEEEHIKRAISDVKVPAGITKVPFAIVTSYGLGRNEGSKAKLLLDNLSSLTICTNILASRCVNEINCNEFIKEYDNYCQTSQQLFMDITIVPNHHYALHLADQMKWWGPLLAISEFPGERINGWLQKVNNNGLIDQMNETMLSKFCQMQRLFALDSVQRKKTKKMKTPKGLSCQMRWDTIHIFETSIKMAPYAQERTSFKISETMRLSKKPPSNLVVYKKAYEKLDNSFAFVTNILQIEIGGVSKTIICGDELLEVEHNNVRKKALTRLHLNNAKQSWKMIYLDENQVIGLEAYRELSSGALGLSAASVLHRTIKNLDGLGVCYDQSIEDI